MTVLQLVPPSRLVPSRENTAFPRAVLAIDFGTASLAAARWATTYIARAADAVLMHVVPVSDCSHCSDATDGKHESLQQMTPALVGGLGGFAATLDVATHRNVVRVGPPSTCLAAIANDAGADLLVLGRRGDANRIRVGEPNVIERATRRTRASVLVVPEGTSSAPEHVVAAVDESPFAPYVLRVASWLSRMHEIPLTVLHVLPPAVGAYDRVIRSATHLIAGVRGKKAKAPARPAGELPSLPPNNMRWFVQLGRAYNVVGRGTAEVAIGDPAREIVRAATERDTSLVVVGMRGADKAPPGSIGSVTRELLTRGPMPVLAVNAI